MKNIGLTWMVILLATILMRPAVAEDDADAILGRWYTEENKSKVEITKDGDTYSGRIVWLKEPLSVEEGPEKGMPLRDANNPEKERQNDPILGLNMLKDFKFNASDNAWDNGTIYDPERGRTYKCVIRMNEDTLDVRGYIGTPLLGRTTQWTRVTKELEETEDEWAPGAAGLE